GGRHARARTRAAPATRAARHETPTSDSETPAPIIKTTERTLKLATPEKSPSKHTESPPLTSLGLMGGLRKPTLLVTPSTVTAPTKSFGSDGKSVLVLI
ncbi:hypothetical protein O3G_MSEX000861, partial [Manduca sexta]